MIRLGRLCVACFSIIVLALSRHDAWSQTARTIKIVVPVPPGASTDFVARLMAEQIGRAQGVTMVVENRPGASGMIGTEAVSRAAPDGTTLLMTANTYLIDAQMRKASYHPVTSFEPICFPGESPAVLVVNSASPYHTLADLLDAARAKPGELTMASVGPGTSFHIGFATFTRMAHVNMTYVPYAGSAPAVNAVLGEHVTSVFTGYAVVAEHLKAGKLRALAAARSSGSRRCRTCRPSTSPAFRDWRWTTGSASSRRRRRRRTRSPSSPAGSRRRWGSPRSRRGWPIRASIRSAVRRGFRGAVRKRYDEYGEAIRDANIKGE